jgi:23S rRNA pseudouridine1911/1915/1917 synthase
MSNLDEKLSDLSPSTIRLLKAVSRQMLHAWKLGFAHPRTGKRMFFEGSHPQDMQSLIDGLRADGG